METESQMLDRHAKELEALRRGLLMDELFTEDPRQSWENHYVAKKSTIEWIEQVLPTIIRKRKNIGVTVGFNVLNQGYIRFGNCDAVFITREQAEKLVGRLLNPGEHLDI